MKGEKKKKKSLCLLKELLHEKQGHGYPDELKHKMYIVSMSSKILQ